MTPTTTPTAISMARRSPGVSGSVGGVLPLLTVGGSFVRRTRPVYNKRILWARHSKARAALDGCRDRAILRAPHYTHVWLGSTRCRRAIGQRASSPGKFIAAVSLGRSADSRMAAPFRIRQPRAPA